MPKEKTLIYISINNAITLEECSGGKGFYSNLFLKLNIFGLTLFPTFLMLGWEGKQRLTF